ncbi:sensor histidine kinase [Christensenella timonensis]|uniref:sensor histidine kinase n=1 Tax=Christensenella timonensis TaxID=1816678 RepID=UPI0013904448|nr:histidine kinase [Christensenella timonensis]
MKNSAKQFYITKTLKMVLIIYFCILVILPAGFFWPASQYWSMVEDDMVAQRMNYMDLVIQHFLADGSLDVDEKIILDAFNGELAILSSDASVEYYNNHAALSTLPTGNEIAFQNCTVITTEHPIGNVLVRYSVRSSSPFCFIDTIIYLMIYIFICIVIFIIIRYRLYLPILKFEKVLTSAVEEEFDFDFSSYKNNRIFKKIFSNLQILMDKMKELLLREANAQLLKKQAEILALQSQINPHFLYNTLDSIRAQALESSNQEVAQMAYSLSKLFRYSISPAEYVTLSDELASIENYIAIQKIRFENKFEYVSDIDQDVISCKIPKLIIQPIVENAISHGIEPICKGAKPEIKISAYRTATFLAITVTDNGLGIPIDRLNKINDALSRNDDSPIFSTDIARKSSIGLKNVNSRIKLLLGSSFGIRISSACNIGTSVEYLLPIIK